MDPLQFRKALGHFATGVTIVTIPKSEGSYHGVTVNAFSSLSLSPPLLLVCLDNDTFSCQFLRKSGNFAVNILSKQQEELAFHFADIKTADNILLEDAIEFGYEGTPILKESLANLTCRVTETFSCGDHTIFVAEVLDIQMKETKAPLVFFNGKFTTTHP
jgi:3-hydroxy-9,10-secoandrosta-1,3,5(10)-triene-9,17-dione monooxygenase reductase component